MNKYHHKKCGGNLRLMVSLYLDIPLELESQLSKANLRRKDVKIQGAGWPTARMYCEKCGWIEAAVKEAGKE